MLKDLTKGVRRPINLFFAEMIIALLFFSISGVVILRIFAAADNKTRMSNKLENVIVCAQSMAEAYSECGNISQSANLVWNSPMISEENHVTTVNLPESDIVLKAYEERITQTAGELAKMHMVFTSDGEELYTLDCSAYIPKEVLE